MATLRAHAFEIGFPEGWSDQSQIVLVGPPRPTFSPNVQVVQEPVPADRTVEAYFAEQREELSNLEAFRLVEHGDRLLAGRKALYHSYTWRVPQGVVIRQTQLALVHAGRVFTITLSALEDDYPPFEPQFEQVLAGFRFR